ncbi:helix-turn-helix domain-containing protein [Zooshikella harenae]|uniref:HTH cro/C1-type domain-containing protein n=1 Tax=Zooshikella harenae TaxID=2827238 RepID=A0ABS5ZK33_9GAMM|nr:hypothetical protein [Zooshikella harenae]MBU2714253.1 hypothetical protein [Zooshikella harenae]
MSISEKLKRRRISLGMTDLELSKKSGLTIYEYGDLESFDDELETVLDLKRLKQLLAVLQTNYFDFFEASKSNLGQFNSLVDMPRNKLIKTRREQLNKSKSELSDDIGFYEYVIDSMESEEDFLENWCIENIKQLAKALNIPVELLMFSPSERNK